MRKKYEYMQDLLKAAKATGFTPHINGRLAVTMPCPECGKKAVILGNSAGVEIDACTCGWRHKDDHCPPEM